MIGQWFWPIQLFTGRESYVRRLFDNEINPIYFAVLNLSLEILQIRGIHVNLLLKHCFITNPLLTLKWYWELANADLILISARIFVASTVTGY